MRSRFIPISFLALLVLIPSGSFAQISSATADHSGMVAYDSFPVQDPYFLFHEPASGSLRAVPPNGTPPFVFNWSRYDSVNHTFLPVFQSDTANDNSQASDLEGGGYRVRIIAADLDTSLRAWVFLNRPHLEVEKDSEGKVRPYRYTCDFLRLNAVALADTLRYYDPATGAAMFVPNDLSFQWSADDPEYEIFGADRYLNLIIYNNPPGSRPPTRDTRFTLTAVDSFGYELSDEVLYESVHVKAEFEMWVEDEEIEGEWEARESPQGESPLEVKFLNGSENGVEFQWTLIDSAKAGSIGDTITYAAEDSVGFTYYIPGYYYPKMIAFSEAGCVDSIKVVTPNSVYVEPSELDAPNVFTPNGDGVNDYFVVKGRSLKDFRITIFSKNGRKVYQYEHREGAFEWQGWDGTLHGKGNAFLSSGVYYYVIEALGWDAEVYRGRPPYKGFVHLFREKD